MTRSEKNYRTQVIPALAGYETAWDALVEHAAGGHVMLSSAYLGTMERTGCVGGRSGWSAQHLLLWDGDELAAACPLYVKAHSYGEYVFDWAWADAYERSGLPYYPKLLCALPFTPVPGARLLARDDAARAALVDVLTQAMDDNALSSVHVLFPDDASAATLQAAGWLKRSGVQFHWTNAGYSHFDEFLTQLSQKKRKNIRAERRAVHEHGLQFDWLDGRSAQPEHWRFFYRCYANTYREHHSTPYLNERFFLELAEASPDKVRLCMARDATSPIAASFFICDAGRLYGRYWGAMRFVPLLHFELCYYQAIEYAIAKKLQVFEGGAQGEHKMARGLMPVPTCSFHRLAHPEFAQAIERFLAREAGGIDQYLDDLNERTPFKRRSSVEQK
ncbi:GNAT family N-acetyltransferase [Piscinibacterium candidicorallinum]|uniref:GNAT family N-acetyltransferase n=1 Tax=Piscinibacterium candidicorallinum TaxID=1793872 RepID=A0ABV7H9H5_9BURK